jgi:hypothetical protein
VTAVPIDGIGRLAAAAALAARVGAEPVPWAELAWLEIDAAERPEWIMAPSALSYVGASDWAARHGLPVRELLHLSDGRTLLRLR